MLGVEMIRRTSRAGALSARGAARRAALGAQLQQHRCLLGAAPGRGARAAGRERAQHALGAGRPGVQAPAARSAGSDAALLPLGRCDRRGLAGRRRRPHAGVGVASSRDPPALQPDRDAPELVAAAQAPLADSRFAEDAPPVLLGAGKLKPQKDFATLLRAERPLQLVIRGEGPGRAHLESLARPLGVADGVALPASSPTPSPIRAGSGCLRSPRPGKACPAC